MGKMKELWSKVEKEKENYSNYWSDMEFYFSTLKNKKNQGGKSVLQHNKNNSKQVKKVRKK